MIQLTIQEKQQLEKIRKAKLEILFTTKDSDGNFLIFNMGQLYLRQKNGDQNRKIGNIYYINDIVMYSKWEDESQMFQKMDAWSIPLLIAKNVDVVQFKTYARQYWIKYDTIKQLLKEKKAVILKFRGMEKKVYIPRTYWKADPIIKDENNMTLLAGYSSEEKEIDMTKYVNRVGPAWAEVLCKYFETSEMKAMGANLNKARQKGRIIYPTGENVFKAFRMTPYDLIKVVIIGQDPYNDPGSATGLAFDCGKKITPSMHKIIEGYSEQYPNNFATDVLTGKLERWTTEGVFLINAALTVRKGMPGSHLEHWYPFTREVILKLNGRPDKGLPPVVYILWGKIAQRYGVLIADDCPIITAEHPAAATYGNRSWAHRNCFLKANEALREMKIGIIDW